MPSFVSNRKTVKARVENGGWKCGYGREITETDAIQGAVAAGVSIYSGNTAAIMAWLDQLIAESIAQMQAAIVATFTAVAREQAAEFAKQVIRTMLQGRLDQEDYKQFGTLAFKAGVCQFLGQNQVWVPGTDIGELLSTGDAGGFWKPVGPHTVAYCPFVGLRVGTADSTGGGNPPQVPDSTPDDGVGPGPTENPNCVNSIFEITLYTSNRLFAGTDAKVFVRLAGTSGKSRITRLAWNVQQLERGSVCKFSIAAKNVGQLSSLWIGHDNTGPTPGWYLDRVTVKDLSTTRQWFFDVDRWLATDEEDGRTYVPLTPTGAIA
jgi:hypothetical protein